MAKFKVTLKASRTVELPDPSDTRNLSLDKLISEEATSTHEDPFAFIDSEVIDVSVAIEKVED